MTDEKRRNERLACTQPDCGCTRTDGCRIKNEERDGPDAEFASGFDELADAVGRAQALALDKIISDGGSSDYYKLPPDAEQIQDLVEFKNMNFSVGNIFKAAYRLGQKAGNDDLYDIRKIIWYANRELARLEKLQQEKA